jgi:hypothetical protein
MWGIVEEHTRNGAERKKRFRSEACKEVGRRFSRKNHEDSREKSDAFESLPEERFS